MEKDHFKEWCDKINQGKTVVISQSHHENIYRINETEYKVLQKAKQNAEYIAELDKSRYQLAKGQTISFKMEELRDMEYENWEVTPKAKKFSQRLSQ